MKGNILIGRLDLFREVMGRGLRDVVIENAGTGVLSSVIWKYCLGPRRKYVKAGLKRTPEPLN